jgi:HPt (histidine-containing phosphotransfer) domain-containing protein
MREPIVVEVESDLEELIPLFLEQRRKDQGVLVQALAAGDFEAMRTVGHGMAGAGSSYGFPEITTMGEAIERAARAHDIADMQKLSAQMSDYMERVIVKYV